MDFNDPSTSNSITLRRSRRLNHQENQSSTLSSEPPTSSNPLPIKNSNHITKIYPLRSRLRRASLTSDNSTVNNRRSRTTRTEDLSSMGLRSGKIVNVRSVLATSTSQDLTSSALPLLAFNPLPRHHQTIHSTSSSSSYLSVSSNNNNNNNNNELNSSICQYHYSNIVNHPSLDSTEYFPARLDILLDRPPVSREKQIEYGWNHDDRSMNIFVKHNDPCTFHRHVTIKTTKFSLFFFFCFSLLPKVQMPFVVKEVLPMVSMFGKSNGMSHQSFESKQRILFCCRNTRQRGTHAVVGVGTIKAPLHCPGYQALVGMNQESWGWDLGRNKLYHKGVNSVYASTQYPSMNASSSSNSSSSSSSPTTTTSVITDPADAMNNNGISYPSKSDEGFVVPDKFFVVLDLEEGTLAYIVDGQYLGVAFSDLKGKGTLYPMVSSVWGHCEITMRYINGLERMFLFCQRNFIGDRNLFFSPTIAIDGFLSASNTKTNRSYESTFNESIDLANIPSKLFGISVKEKNIFFLFSI